MFVMNQSARPVNGLTLIELMIVVAIIAMLAAIAIPAYSVYTTRTQLAAGLSDISGGRTMFESQVVAMNATTFDPADIGLSTSTPRCSDIQMDPSHTNGYIRCILNGNPAIMGKSIEIRRNSSGEWHCVVDPTIVSTYHPFGCT